MKLKVLGCSGGIGGRHLRTTALLVDDDILIDAGTGVAELEVAQLVRIDHVFLTHCHLDHIACLPLMLDTVVDLRERPLVVHATQATQDILRSHVFNWRIWPDFSEIPSRENPCMRFNTIQVGQRTVLNGRTITALPANHAVPAVGYRLDSGAASLVFTGDTSVNDALWTELNEISGLRYLIIETAFSNRDRQLAILSKHLCPSLLSGELLKLRQDPEIFITHLKPGQGELIMREIEGNTGRHRPRMLQTDHLFEF